MPPSGLQEYHIGMQTKSHFVALTCLEYINYIVQAGLEFTVGHLHLPPKYWDLNATSLGFKINHLKFLINKCKISKTNKKFQTRHVGACL